MVAFTNPMYKKSCELTENNDNNVDNIVIVKHWEGRVHSSFLGVVWAILIFPICTTGFNSDMQV